MTRATRRTLVDIYGALLKAVWGEPTDRAEEPASEAEPSRQEDLELKKVMRAIKQLQRSGEL